MRFHFQLDILYVSCVFVYWIRKDCLPRPSTVWMQPLSGADPWKRQRAVKAIARLSDCQTECITGIQCVPASRGSVFGQRRCGGVCPVVSGFLAAFAASCSLHDGLILIVLLISIRDYESEHFINVEKVTG